MAVVIISSCLGYWLPLLALLGWVTRPGDWRRMCVLLFRLRWLHCVHWGIKRAWEKEIMMMTLLLLWAGGWRW
jgi:hypothetical protein